MSWILIRLLSSSNKRCRCDSKVEIVPVYYAAELFTVVKSRSTDISTVMRTTELIFDTSKIAINQCVRKIYSFLLLVPTYQVPHANKLLTFLMSTWCQRLWPLPSPVALGHPNQAHRRHLHTMGNGACTRFGRSHGVGEHCTTHHPHIVLSWIV